MTVNRENLLNGAVFFFFALFVFSSAFSIAVSQASFGISLLLFIVLAITKRYNPGGGSIGIFYAAVGSYLLWMLISSMVNGVPLGNLKEEWLFCIIPVGTYLFRQKQYRWLLVTALALGVIIVSVYGVIQHYTGINGLKDSLLSAARDNTFYAVGGFDNNLTYGNYLAVAALFLISISILKGNKSLATISWLVLTAGVLGFIGTVMSYSRTAVAALPLGLLTMTWLKGRRWVMASAALLIVGGTLTFLFVGQLAFKYKLAFEKDLAGEHDSSRLFIWKKTLEITYDNSIFGVGQGNFEKSYAGYLDSTKNEIRTRPHAHNDFLNFAAIAGIPGALIFISIWVVLFYNFHNIWHRSEPFSDKKVFAGAAAVGGITFILASLTEATFVDEEVRQLLMVVWAAGLWPLLSSKKGENLDQIESA